MKYTFIDELLTVIICHYYFRKPRKDFSFQKLWQTKKFRIFNHNLLDDTYLLTKLKIVRAIRELPKQVRDDIERLNALRNALAHSFFPENRRQYASHKKVIYKDFDIFSKAGVEKFQEDIASVEDCLWRRAYGR